MISLRQRVLWAGVLASAAFAASAQTPPPPAAAAAAAQAQGGPQHRMDREASAKQRMERMQEVRAKRLDRFKVLLQLTPQQEGAWTTYTDAIKPSAPPNREDFRARRAEFEKLTTPQRLDRIQQRQAERQAQFAKRSDATRTFYAQLTPPQQKVFDVESLHAGPRHGAEGHHGKGPHGGPRAHGAHGEPQPSVKG